MNAKQARVRTRYRHAIARAQEKPGAACRVYLAKAWARACNENGVRVRIIERGEA